MGQHIDGGDVSSDDDDSIKVKEKLVQYLDA